MSVCVQSGAKEVKGGRGSI